MSEHAVNLGAEDVGLVERFTSGELEEVFVGHRGPEKIGESGGEGVGIEFAFVFFQVKKTWGTKDGLEAELEGFQGICSRIEFVRDEGENGFYFTLGGRSAEGF